jgi:hypothetical protein
VQSDEQGVSEGVRVMKDCEESEYRDERWKKANGRGKKDGST